MGYAFDLNQEIGMCQTRHKEQRVRGKRIAEHPGAGAAESLEIFPSDQSGMCPIKVHSPDDLPAQGFVTSRPTPSRSNEDFLPAISLQPAGISCVLKPVLAGHSFPAGVLRFLISHRIDLMMIICFY
jgi:hypothetical protein